MTDVADIINSIPKEVMQLRANNQLHKLAQRRMGTDDFGIDSAVGFIAKKAYYNRQVNKAIAASINAVDTLNS
jgi:hypothetical protein